MWKMWNLAWPVMILGLSRVAMRTTDILVVGFLGSWAVASIGLGDVWMRLLLFLGLGIGTGTLSRVARARGDGDEQGMADAMTQSLVIVTALGAVASLVLWFLSSTLIGWLGAPPVLIREGGNYLRWVGISSIPRLIYLVVFRGMAAVGDTRTPVLIGVSTTLVNILITVLLVFGYGGFPRLGVVGAAAGTSIGNLLAGVFCLGFMILPGYPLSISSRGWHRWREGIHVIRIGVPRVLTGGIQAMGDVPLHGILLWFGSEVVAAYQIAKRVLMLAMMPNWGIGTAAGSFTGRHLGRGEPGQAREQGWMAVRLSLLITGPLAALLALAQRPVSYLFIREEPTLTLSGRFIMVFAVAIVLMGIHRSLASSLEGAGQTMVPLVATGVGMGTLLGGSALLCGPFGFGLPVVYMLYVADHLLRGFIVGGWYEAVPWAETRSSSP